MLIISRQQISYASIVAELSKHPKGGRFTAHQPLTIHIFTPKYQPGCSFRAQQKLQQHLPSIKAPLFTLCAYCFSKQKHHSKYTPSKHQKIQSSHQLGYPTCTTTTRPRATKTAGRDTPTYIKRFQTENRKTDKICQKLKVTREKFSS